MIKYTRLFSDTNGDTHFEEKEIETTDLGTIGFLSEKIAVKDLIFREVVHSYDYDFHNAPQKQFLILLDGEIEIETSLGVKKRFVGGDVLLLEDTTGKGHKSKNISQIMRKSLFITLP
jgi:hypothetical protein